MTEMIRKILSFSVCFSLFLFFLSIIWICFLSQKKLDEGNRISSYIYKYIQYSSADNHSSNGFVTLSRKLEKETSFAVINEKENHILISPFESSEFLCYGRCNCNELSNTERRNSMFFTKNLQFLMAAVTALIAQRKAKELLEEECEGVMEESCSMDSISSEIGDCRKISSGLDKKKQEHEYRRYDCKGNCLRKHFRRVKPHQMADDFSCEKLELIDTIELDTTGMTRSYRQNNAMRQFQRDLVTFCYDMSSAFYDYVYRGKKHQRVEVRLCVGSEDGINRTIKCIEHID